MDEKEAEGAVCTFFKKSNKGSRSAAARRKKDSSSSSSDDGGGIVKKERKRATGMVAGSSGTRKKQKTEGGNDGNDSDDVDDLLVLAKADGKVYGARDENVATEIEASRPVASDKGKQQVSSFIKPGPRTGTTNIRITQRFDYQPDVCKDYKETGYCGFGDTCKFLHDRSDYKTGWQLEREWEAGNYGKRENLEVESSSESEDELPFACLICREPFNNPVVTKCQHYFCLNCAVDHYKRDKKCFVCQAQTNGIFNAAKGMHMIKRNK